MAHIIKVQDGKVIFESADPSAYDANVTVKGTIDVTAQLTVAGDGGLPGQVLTSNGPGIPQTWTNNIGNSGFSGYSGFIGAAGTSGFSGYSGIAGTSGYSGLGLSGYSGQSGIGTSGFSGISGATSIGGAYVFVQPVPTITWIVTHNLGIRYVNVEVIDSTGISFAGRYDYPTVTFVDTNTVSLTFTSAVAGYAAVTSGGGISGFSGTSGLPGAVSASGYSGVGTSGYSGASGVGISGYSGTSGLGLSGYSGQSGASTSGFSGTSGTSGATSVAGGYVFTQAVPSTTWNISHNLGIQYVNVEVIDAAGVSYAGRYDYPTVTFIDANNLTLTFISAVSGHAAVTSGGGTSGFSG